MKGKKKKKTTTGRGEIDREWREGIYLLQYQGLWTKLGKKEKLKESYYKIIKVQQFLAYFTQKWIIKS